MLRVKTVCIVQHIRYKYHRRFQSQSNENNFL